MPAPYPVTTRNDFVRRWLAAHRAEIVAAEATFNVDRRAIAGAIAWEAMVNVIPGARK